LRPRPGDPAKESGIATGCLSNIWGEGDFDPHAGWDLGGKFDAVVMSGDGQPSPSRSARHDGRAFHQR
jgi:hypothetical protein